MDARLMTDADLHQVTGRKRKSAQAAWFRLHFGIEPVQAADGRIILTWAAFEGMQAKRMGVLSAPSAPTQRPSLISVRRTA